MAGGGKSDMERIGIFSENGYISIGDPYVPPGQLAFNDAATKGKQMLAPGPKSKTATQSGYFAKSFDRILEGEAFTDPIKIRRQQKIKDAQRNVGKPWVPVNADKAPSGVGSNYGTFSGPIQYVSPQTTAPPPYKAPGKNIMTNPPKKGTGFGYLNVTIGKSYPYHSEKYNNEEEQEKKSREEGKRMMKGAAMKAGSFPKEFFDSNPFKPDKIQPTYKDIPKNTGEKKVFKPSNPGKKPGGVHAGTFTAYPSHSEEKFTTPSPKKVVEVVNSSGKKFIPSSGPRPYPIYSLIDMNIKKEVTPLNYKSVECVW